jgi:hypothetical protein
VFINYRGQDSYSYGALLHAELSRRFGPESVFLDAESIPAGADYAEQLLGRVRGARVVLAVIGPRWLDAANGGGRLIDDPADWVRRELVAAFEAGVRVIPVLTDEVPMPREGWLPEELAALGRCQYRRLRHRDAAADLARLAADLAEADAELAVALRRGPYSGEEVDCPYLGMAPFGPEQARYFRGRDKLIAALLSRVAVQVRRGGGPLVVIGPSGVGSRRCCGPACCRRWPPVTCRSRARRVGRRVYLRPGTDPLGELAAQVARLGMGEEDLPAAMRADPEALRRVLSRAVDTAAVAPTAAAPAAVEAGAVGSVAQGSAAGDPGGSRRAGAGRWSSRRAGGRGAGPAGGVVHPRQQCGGPAGAAACAHPRRRALRHRPGARGGAVRAAGRLLRSLRPYRRPGAAPAGQRGPRAPP